MGYSWHWSLKNTQFKKNKGKVFSCFSGGGGSTMGYKLSGFDVIGCLESAPKMMKVYVQNHSPKHSYLEMIQDFKKRKDLPGALYNLDILDGSPPCSSFSTNGKRDKFWGKEKRFNEGGQLQVLDTLFFDFIDLAEKLQPKIIVAENVKGLLLGKAMSYKQNYVNQIHTAFNKAGYVSQHYLLDASKMGVPQKRGRVFFIAIRKDTSSDFIQIDKFFGYSLKLNLSFNEKPILFGEIRSKRGKNYTYPKFKELLQYREKTDTNLGEISMRINKNRIGFSNMINADHKVSYVLTNRSVIFRMCDGKELSKTDIIRISAFPYDFNFLNYRPQTICGMAVPPIMIAQIADKLYNQILSKL